jgi:adenylate kinase family enzyme
LAIVWNPVSAIVSASASTARTEAAASTSLSIGRRIAVVGSAASGKSTLARRVAEALKAPVIELDALFWQRDWHPSADDDFKQRVLEATRGAAWVLDGHYQRLWSAVWPAVDTVIWLDLPLPQLVWRGARRSWRRLRTGEVLWGTNVERPWRQLQVWDPNKSLLAWLLVTHRERRRQYVHAALDPRWSHIRFVRLCSSDEVELLASALAAVSQPVPE